MGGRASRVGALTLPFLMLAYPVTYLLFLGGRYCGSLCFTPTPRGVANVAATLLALFVLAGGLAAGLRFETFDRNRTFVRRLVAPPRAAQVILFGLLAAFAVFLTLDALSLYESLWKPVVLPLSLLVFLPVWLLYTVTFPLALLFSVAGVDPGPVVTLATRAVVLFVGLPLSAVAQTLAVSAIVERAAGPE